MKIVSLVRIESKYCMLFEEATQEKIVFLESEKELEDTACLAEIVICKNAGEINQYLPYFSNLKWIFVISTGIENICLDELSKRNIRIAHAVGISDEAISNYVIGGMLLFSCQFNSSINLQKMKKWRPYVTTEPLNNKNILIVGTGRIGTAIAKKAKAFDMNIYGINRRGRENDYFKQIFSLSDLSQCLNIMDFIVCALPLTEDTKYVFNYDIFFNMNPSAVFINISRGQLVDTQALIEALECKRLAGAVLDVFESEPLEESSRLWSVPNIIITPHSSGRLKCHMKYVMDIFARNVQQYKKDRRLISEVIIENGY